MYKGFPDDSISTVAVGASAKATDGNSSLRMARSHRSSALIGFASISTDLYPRLAAGSEEPLALGENIPVPRPLPEEILLL